MMRRLISGILMAAGLAGVTACGHSPADQARKDALEAEKEILRKAIKEERVTSGGPQLKIPTDESSTSDKSKPDETAKPAESKVSQDTGPFVLGDLVAPFTPPPLAEIDKNAQWIDRPVLDSLEFTRQRQAKEKPLATVAEALALKNDSAEANAKILSALGRQPADPKEMDADAVMIRRIPADINVTNPLLVSSTYEVDIHGLLHFGLFSFDRQLEPFAAKEAVVSWQSSKDGMFDKVVMRDDLTWSDGKPLTARDVEFSYKAIMSKQVPVPAVRNGTEKLKWVTAYDDRTLVFFHPAPLSTNPWNINFPVLPQHIYSESIARDPTLTTSEEHIKRERNPVVGGAYELAKWVRGSTIVVKRRESYYMHNGKQVRDKPSFKEVHFQIITDPAVALLAAKRGSIDDLELTAEQWQTQTNDDAFYKHNTKARAIQWLEFQFLWNTAEPFFRDKRVRQAMSYAFDHEEMLSKLRFGLDEPATGPFHHTSRWAAKDGIKPFQRNVEMAEKLLDEAGWTDSDGDGRRDMVVDGKKRDFEFSLLVSNRQDRIDLCTLFKQNLDEIGITCNVRPLEFTVLLDLQQNRKFQASYGGWGTGAHPDTLENIFGSKGERNYGSYSNPKIDELFAAGRNELDLEKRTAIYQQIHRILYEDQPYTWLFYQNAYYAFNKKVRGYEFSPRGPYHYGPGFSALWMPAAQ